MLNNPTCSRSLCAIIVLTFSENVIPSKALRILPNEHEGNDFHLKFHIDNEEHQAQSHGERLLRVWSNKTHCLNFMHIPKTAGSTIERFGKDAKENWGIQNNLHCSSMQTCPDGFPWHSHQRCCRLPDKSLCSVWHVPPATDPVLQESYKKCETFCVIREPSSRFRSQHHWSGGACTTQALEEATFKKLAQLKTHPYQDDCHLAPQSEFVANSLCQHMLRFENLADDFDSLMKTFGIEAVMSKTGHASGCTAPYTESSKAELRKFYDSDLKLQKRFGF